MTYMNLPSLSIITVALNCENILEECYSRMVSQDYPKDKIELLCIDGGSTDRTRDVAVKWGARVIDGGYKENQEARRYVGYMNAKNEILVYLDSDNFLTEKEWLKKMVQPLIEDSEIIATQTLRYEYDKSQSLMNRYFALFGVNDPVAFYLGKADRLPWFNERWNLRGNVICEKETYYKVQFSTDFLPTIGCNGFLVRRSAFEKLNYEPEDFLHIDANYDLIKMGLNKYGIVKTAILHATGDTFVKSIRKRMDYMGIHHQRLRKIRRYRVFDATNRNDVLNLIKFVLFACTLFKPFYDSLKGYIKIRDIAWFLHPFICIGFTIGYGYSTIYSGSGRRK